MQSNILIILVLIIYVSFKKDKKYMIIGLNGKTVHFGQFNPPTEDYTKHNDLNRRNSYLSRATNIKGNWKDDPYSPNNLGEFIVDVI